MLVGDVADQLVDDDGFADACPAKDADFTPSREGGDQVDGLEARFKYLDFGDCSAKEGCR